MWSVVADEDLVLVVSHDTVGKLQMSRAAELVQHGAVAIEHHHTHHLHTVHSRPHCELTVATYIHGSYYFAEFFLPNVRQLVWLI